MSNNPLESSVSTDHSAQMADTSTWITALEKAARSWRATQCWSFVRFFLITGLTISFAILGIGLLYSLVFQTPGQIESMLMALWTIVLFLMSSLFMITIIFWPFLFFFTMLTQVNRRHSLAVLLQYALHSKTSLPILLRTLASTTSSFFYRRKLNRFANDLETGRSFKEAIERSPGLLPDDSVRLIQLQGDAPEALQLINESLDNDNEQSSIYIFSMTRFAYLMVIAWQICLMIMFGCFMIFPRLQMIYSDFDTLPWFFSLFSDIFRWGLPWFPLLLFGITFGGLFLLLLKLNLLSIRPWFLRGSFREGDSAKLLRMLSAGVQRNITFSQTMLVYGQSLKSRYLRKQAKKIQKAIDAGLPWVESLRKQNIINRQEAALLETAQRTENSALMLNELSRTKEAKQNRNDDVNSKLVFAASICIAGLLVAFFAVATLSPVFHLTELMAK